MMAQTNNDDFDDELLSAYVDGELTTAERALVEERLRSDPAAAALVDELRSLSSTIQSLPRETLGRDLRAGVIAEVEQARADLERHGPATLPLEPIDRWKGIRRGLVWSALAIAATVVVAVFQPAEVEQEGRILARAEKREADEKLHRPERRLRGFDGANEDASADKLAQEPLAADADALPPGLRGSMSSGGGDAANAAEGNEKAVAAAPLMAEAAPAEEPMLDAVSQEALSATAPAEASAGAAMNKDSVDDRGQASGEAVALQDSPALAPSSAPTPLATAQPYGEASGASGAPMAMGGGGAFGPRGGVAFGYGGEAAAIEEAREGGQATAAPAGKVTLKLATTDGASRFKELLAESDIAPADDAEAKEEIVGRRFDQLSQSNSFGRAADDAKQDSIVSEERSLYFDFSESPSPPADAAENLKLGVKLESIRGVMQPGSNLVWVEATPAQIEALLEKCRDDKEAFAAVVADDNLLLVKKAESDAAEMKLKRLARAEQAPAEPESEIAAGEKRERVLFVLEPATPALKPAAPAASPPATSEAK